jgi:diaminopimelate epimerase
MTSIKSLQGEDTYLSIETLAGIRRAKVYLTDKKVNRVEVSMGIPEFRADNIPTTASYSTLTNNCQQQTTESKQCSLLNCSLSVGDEKLQLWLLSMGNPHAITFLSQTIANYPLSEFGPMVENDPLFPNRTNFEIARVLDKDKIEARVWERGVGETLSCGSGACAIAVVSKLLGYTGEKVDITLNGGILSIFWDGIGEVKLTGPVDEVFTGKYLI